ncbi:indole-3-glycerol phosphate synthase TrpC [Desulfonema magnum]|uniref:Indole-3-glycerol phosphate synthase n=1 Tax=Desulfonema magnum TaxID=45655 RepID=A0A975BRL6_9BACT|nr:indole-3-glycerol phosphate synthase TrpC [Desulfonema magnum]QTA90406.1 Indole-3-glycerol phosphate synthase [Desulfonema magnum]
MTDFLSKIVEQKKQEIAAAQKRLPETQVREQAFIPRKRRGFLKNMERPGTNIIAEIKRASPSKGVICPDLNPARYASQYEQGGAAALSVLTDTPYFQGSFEDFKAAREAAGLPMIRKDFLISSYQIYESSVLEADAVLLIVRILSAEQLRDYLSLCAELELDALVEVHSEEDIEAASRAGAKLIGINNRNLSSFETNIETAINMVSLLEPGQIPVAESGIRGPEDVQKLRQAGIRNFLIGESLVRASDPRAFLKSLILDDHVF